MPTSFQVLSFPAGARLLRVETANLGNSGYIQRDPIRYLHEAVKLQRPANADVMQGAEIVEAIMQQIEGGGLEMRRKRISLAKRINELCVLQSNDEKKLRNELPRHLKRVVKKKRLLLFEQLLQDMHYGDKKIATEMISGFQLVGWVQPSGVCPAKVRPPLPHRDMLNIMALHPSNPLGTASRMLNSGR